MPALPRSFYFIDLKSKSSSLFQLYFWLLKSYIFLFYTIQLHKKVFGTLFVVIVWFFEIQNFWEISGQSLRVNKTSGRWRSCFTYEGGNLLFQEWPLHGGYYLLLGWNLPCGSSQVGFQSENILKKCRPNVYTCTKTSSRTEVLLAGGVEPNHFEGV